MEGKDLIEKLRDVGGSHEKGPITEARWFRFARKSG
jgi:hypothetical protein